MGALPWALQGAPAARTETRPVLRTLLHCEGCGDPSLCDQGKPTHTRWSGQQSHSWAAATHAGMSAPRCCVWALEAAGLSAAWAAATSSPHAITAGQRGTARRPGGYRSAQLHPAMPCGRESLAVTSGDKAPYGDGEGRRLATACGRLGEGSGGGGSPPVPAQGFCMFSCSHLPGLTFNGGASRVSHSRQQQGPCGPHAGGSEQQPAARPRTRKHHVLGWTPGAGGEGARVTLPCLENMNLHVKVGVGPHPGHRVPWLWRQDHGAVQNGSGEGSGTRSSRHGASLGARSGGRQQVRSPGDVEIC